MNIPSISTGLQADSQLIGAARTQPTDGTPSNGGAVTGAGGASAPPSADLKAAGSSSMGEALAAQQPTSLEQVQQAMEDVRNAIAPVAQDLLFSIDEDTGKTIVKVVDASTDEVIRQIPSEEIISIAKALDKLQGLLVEQKA
jgi:flagellar protein FlaG